MTPRAWYDRPRKGLVYRWLHHMWVLSFNRNPSLYRVVWWSRFTRPIAYNTQGKVRGGGWPFFAVVVLVVWFIVGPLIATFRQLF